MRFYKSQLNGQKTRYRKLERGSYCDWCATRHPFFSFKTFDFFFKKHLESCIDFIGQFTFAFEIFSSFASYNWRLNNVFFCLNTKGTHNRIKEKREKKNMLAIVMKWHGHGNKCSRKPLIWFIWPLICVFVFARARGLRALLQS